MKWLYFILCLLLASPSFAQVWTQKANFPGTARYSANGFAINGKGYIGTGWDGVMKNDFYEYEPASNSWAQKANFPGTARQHVAAFVINGKGYFGLGSDSYPAYNFMSDFYEYEPTGNSWTPIASFPGTPRYTTSSFTIGNDAYTGTGWDQVTPYFSDFFKYSQTLNQWTQIADFGGTARQTAIGFAIGNKGYVGTGWDGGNTNDFWEYEPTSNIWTQKANFGGNPRYAAVSFVIGNKGYIVTGGDVTVKYNDFWEYDPNTNLWTQLANFPGAGRYAAVGFSIDSCGYVGTGQIGGLGQFTDDFWAYCISCLATTTTANTSICTGDSIFLQGNYQTTAGTYYDTLSTVNGCDSIVATALSVGNSLAKFSFLTKECSAEVAFFDSSQNANSFFWDFGDGSSPQNAGLSNPTHNYSSSGNYIVTLFINQGTSCPDSASQTLKLDETNLPLFIPNCFSPNNDGLNDVFEITGIECKNYSLYIFNRWGELIYFTPDFSNFWDGKYQNKVVQDDVYVYILKNEEEKRYGTVLVLK